MTFPFFPGSCPECGRAFTAATCITEPGKEPKPGHRTLCISCAAALTWDDDMILQTDPDPPDPILAAQKNLRLGKLELPKGAV